MDTNDYIQTMRNFPGAVNIVTTGEGDMRAGLTATAVMSLTAEPPQIAVAVNRGASAYPRIRENGTFCVNTLGAHQSQIARSFSGGAKGLARFEVGEWRTLVTGSPILAESVLSLDCRIADVVSFSTHDLLIGSVEAVCRNDPTRPLLYVDGKWASLLPGTTPDVDRIMNVVERSHRSLDEAIAAGGDKREQLKDFAYKFALLNIDAQAITQEYSNNELYVDPDSLTKLNGARREFDTDVLRFVEAGVADGTFDVDDPQIASFAVLGMMIWTFKWYRSNGRLKPETIAEQLATLSARVVGDADPGRTGLIPKQSRQ